MTYLLLEWNGVTSIDTPASRSSGSYYQLYLYRETHLAEDPHVLGLVFVQYRKNR